MKEENVDTSFEEVRNLLAIVVEKDPDELDGVEVLREKWESNKSWLFPFFDEWGRREIVPDFSQEQITGEDIVNACNSAYKKAEQIKAEKERFKNEPFVCVSCTTNFLNNFIDNFSTKDLVENKISKPFLEFNAGTKISRILRSYPLSVYGHKVSIARDPIANEALVREFIDIVFSNFLSFLKKRNDTKVILSINPLDILMASAHTTGWRSCHKFTDGQFKTGPLSYMCDGVTAIAYAYDRVDNYKLEEYTTSVFLPVKKWRQMVYFDRNNFSAIHSREYPCENTIYGKYSRKLAGYVLAEYAGKDKKWKVKFYNEGSACLEEERDDVSSCNLYLKTCWAYRDNPTAFIYLNNVGHPPKVFIGVDIPCVVCGEIRGNDTTETLDCHSCDRRIHCCSCDCDLEEGSAYYYDGETYCSYCFHDSYGYCVNCGEAFELDDLTRVANDDLVCDDCLDANYAQCNCCDQWVESDSLTETACQDFVCDDCLERYYDYCYGCKEWYPEEDIAYYCEDTGNIYCEECGEEQSIEQCSGCGNYFERDYVRINGEVYCKHCAREVMVV